MIALIAHYWFWLLLAFLLGLATAWWAWGQTPRTGKDDRGAIRDADGDWPAPDQLDAQPARPTSDAIDRADGTETAAPEPPDTDDLTHIKGIDPPMAGLLKLLGVSRYSEIADWADADAEEMSVLLGAAPGRIVDGQWIEQARLLAAGNMAEFESRFGHL